MRLQFNIRSRSYILAMPDVHWHVLWIKGFTRHHRVKAPCSMFSQLRCTCALTENIVVSYPFIIHQAWCVTRFHTNPTEKFYDFSMTFPCQTIQISRQNLPTPFVGIFAFYISICRINHTVLPTLSVLSTCNFCYKRCNSRLIIWGIWLLRMSWLSYSEWIQIFDYLPVWYWNWMYNLEKQ